MAKFKRLVLMDKGGPWELQEAEVPKPGPNQILVKVKASTICNMTDLNTVKAKHPPHDHQKMMMLPHHFRVWDKQTEGDPLAKNYVDPYPFNPYPSLMGHEGMGEIVEIGPVDGSDETLGLDPSQYTQDFGPYLMSQLHGNQEDFKIGDRVTCMGNNGGFGEYVLVPRAIMAKIPDDVTDEVGAFAEMVGFTNLFPRELVRYGDTVVILAQGAVGLMCTIFARHLYNAGTIITTDPQPFKREMSLKCGADYAIDPNKTNVVEFVKEVTKGKGANVILECVGFPESVSLIPYIAGWGCKVGQIGAGCDPVTTDWCYIHFKGLVIHSAMSIYARYGIGAATQAAVKVLNDQRVKALLEALVTHRIPLTTAAAEDIFKKIEKGDEVIKAAFIPKIK
jgi:threonine dehydrogenase-like Zn-dependent dehydrogenase